MLSLHSSPIGPLGTQNTGGMSVYVRELSRYLGRRGHRVDIFTCAGSTPPEIGLYPNVRLITLDQGRFAQISKEALPDYLPRLAQAVEGFRRDHGATYDLIHSHYWISGVVGAIIQVQWQCPHLTMFHTLGAAKNRNGSGENETALRIGHEQRLAAAADRIVAPSQAELDNLARHCHAPREKIAVVPCGVDLALFFPRDRLAARRRLGLSPDAQLVLFVGRFAPLKAVDRLIEAVAGLRRSLPRLQLILVGGDDPAAPGTLSLNQLVDHLGIRDGIYFAGCIDHADLTDYYCAADLLALPSHYESFGLVVLEAMACGTPVAVTSVGVAATIVRPGINGAIIAAPETKAMAETIANFFETPEAQRPSVAQVRASVQNYGWQSVAEAIAQLYSAMTKAHNLFDTPRMPISGG